MDADEKQFWIILGEICILGFIILFLYEYEKNNK